ncbi:MAG: NAD(P)-dependent alcohol dehydrogenase [Bacteroidota bacterium]
MKAITFHQYGSPEVLQLEDLSVPSPKAHEVLIRVHASSLSPVDCFNRLGKPFVIRFFMGLFTPQKPTLGSDLAGEIVAVGKSVSKFQIGDKVFGATIQLGGHAEYICLSEEEALIPIPTNMTMEEAAAIPYGALTALPFLRDAGNIQAGMKVLINGASGSIGTCAVQLAKFYGAEVTGVCSGRNMELVRSLGADHVIDYTREDFTQNGELYDIVFDTVGKRSYGECKKSLTVQGIYLNPDISWEIIPQMWWTSLFGKKKAKIAFTGLRPIPAKIKDLYFLTELIEEGLLTAIIDRQYKLEEATRAHRYVETGRKRGNVLFIP